MFQLIAEQPSRVYQLINEQGEPLRLILLRVEEELRRHLYHSYKERHKGDPIVAIRLAMVPWWVRHGIAQPGTCVLSYPVTLLEYARKWDQELGQFLDLRDVDCGDALLTDEPVPLPKHICPATIRESTRKYARLRFPPRNTAQRRWVSTWPFPVGERSMRAFARSANLDREDLPPAPVGDNPTARIGLWVERRPYRSGVLEDGRTWGGASRVTTVTLIGRACREDRSRSKGKAVYELCRAHIQTAYKGSTGTGEFAESGELIPTWFEDEWEELGAAKRQEKELLLWYERRVQAVNNERRGRKRGHATPDLERARALFSEARAKAAQRARREKRCVRPADLLLEYQKTEDLNYLTPSTFYGWISGRKLPPLVDGESSE